MCVCVYIYIQTSSKYILYVYIEPVVKTPSRAVGMISGAVNIRADVNSRAVTAEQ